MKHGSKIALAEAKKGRMDVELTSGEKLEALVRERSSLHPEVLDRVRKLLIQ